MQPQNQGESTSHCRPPVPETLEKGTRPTAMYARRTLSAPIYREERSTVGIAQKTAISTKEHVHCHDAKENNQVTQNKKQSKSLYADLLTEQELAALERTADNPLLQDEIGLLRMLIRRIAAQLLNAEDDERAPADKIKAVKDLTDILLNALKARHQLSPRAEDNLTEAMRQVVAEIESLERQEEKVQEHRHAE